MKTTPALALATLAAFAMFGTGCVTVEDDGYYQPTTYSSGSHAVPLPAVVSGSRVILELEFSGGIPSAEEEQEVSAILVEQLTRRGSVLVADRNEADFLIHVVLERRNPSNPSEWTVAASYAARSRDAYQESNFRWPGGVIEDDHCETIAVSRFGFGIFYPVWFEWSDHSWRYDRVVVCPPQHRHPDYADREWRESRRYHRPERWENCGSKHHPFTGDSHRPKTPPGQHREEPRHGDNHHGSLDGKGNEHSDSRDSGTSTKRPSNTPPPPTPKPQPRSHQIVEQPNPAQPTSRPPPPVVHPSPNSGYNQPRSPQPTAIPQRPTTTTPRPVPTSPPAASNQQGRPTEVFIPGRGMVPLPPQPTTPTKLTNTEQRPPAKAARTVDSSARAVQPAPQTNPPGRPKEVYIPGRGMVPLPPQPTTTPTTKP